MSCDGNRAKFLAQVSADPLVAQALGGGDAGVATRVLTELYDLQTRRSDYPDADATALTRVLFAQMRQTGLTPPTHSADGLPRASARQGYAALAKTLTAIRSDRPLPPAAAALVTRHQAGTGAPALGMALSGHARGPDQVAICINGDDLVVRGGAFLPMKDAVKGFLAEHGRRAGMAYDPVRKTWIVPDTLRAGLTERLTRAGYVIQGPHDPPPPPSAPVPPPAPDPVAPAPRASTKRRKAPPPDAPPDLGGVATTLGFGLSHETRGRSISLLTPSPATFILVQWANGTLASPDASWLLDDLTQRIRRDQRGTGVGAHDHPLTSAAFAYQQAGAAVPDAVKQRTAQVMLTWAVQQIGGPTATARCPACGQFIGRMRHQCAAHLDTLIATTDWAATQDRSDRLSGPLPPTVDLATVTVIPDGELYPAGVGDDPTAAAVAMSITTVEHWLACRADAALIAWAQAESPAAPPPEVTARLTALAGALAADAGMCATDADQITRDRERPQQRYARALLADPGNPTHRHAFARLICHGMPTCSTCGQWMPDRTTHACPYTHALDVSALTDPSVPLPSPLDAAAWATRLPWPHWRATMAQTSLWTPVRERPAIVSLANRDAGVDPRDARRTLVELAAQIVRSIPLADRASAAPHPIERWARAITDGLPDAALPDAAQALLTAAMHYGEPPGPARCADCGRWCTTEHRCARTYATATATYDWAASLNRSGGEPPTAVAPDSRIVATTDSRFAGVQLSDTTVATWSAIQADGPTRDALVTWLGTPGATWDTLDAAAAAHTQALAGMIGWDADQGSAPNQGLLDHILPIQHWARAWRTHPDNRRMAEGFVQAALAGSSHCPDCGQFTSPRVPHYCQASIRRRLDDAAATLVTPEAPIAGRAMEAHWSQVAGAIAGHECRVRLIPDQGFATDMHGHINAEPYPLGEDADPRHNMLVTKAGIYHEIGHELFTPPGDWQTILDIAHGTVTVPGIDAGRALIATMYNIVEDGRMERAISDAFPGVNATLAASCQVYPRWHEQVGDGVPLRDEVMWPLLYTALPYFRVRDAVRAAMTPAGRALFEELEPVVAAAVRGDAADTVAAAITITRRFEAVGIVDAPTNIATPPPPPPPGTRGSPLPPQAGASGPSGQSGQSGQSGPSDDDAPNGRGKGWRKGLGRGDDDDVPATTGGGAGDQANGAAAGASADDGGDGAGDEANGAAGDEATGGGAGNESGGGDTSGGAAAGDDADATETTGGGAGNAADRDGADGAGDQANGAATGASADGGSDAADGDESGGAGSASDAPARGGGGGFVTKDGSVGSQADGGAPGRVVPVDDPAPLTPAALDAVLNGLLGDADAAIKREARRQGRYDALGARLHAPLGNADTARQVYRDPTGTVVSIDTAMPQSTRTLPRTEQAQNTQIASRFAQEVAGVRQEAEVRLRATTGTFDTRRLVSAMRGEETIYTRAQSESRTGMAVSVLLDQSGSMTPHIQSGKLRRATQIMGAAFEELGMPYEVRGHGGSSTQYKAMDDPTFDPRRAAALQETNTGSNRCTAPVAALALAALLARPDPNRLIVNLMDGEMDDHAATVAQYREVRQQGVISFGVFLGDPGQHARTKLNQIFGAGNWRAIRDLSDLPKVVGRRSVELFEQLGHERN